MKTAVILCGFFAFVCAEVVKDDVPVPDVAAVQSNNALKAKLFRRDLRADILRDFPGFCFASTQCRVYKEGEFWSLEPFCGMAECVAEIDSESGNYTGHFIEQVSDCGPLPAENPQCNNTNAVNSETPFPECCPVFLCEEGAVLVYPDDSVVTEEPIQPGGEREVGQTKQKVEISV